jgi:hypothetical protein
MRFAVAGIGAMTFEAFVREDGPDIKVIADFSRGSLWAVVPV